MKHGMIAKIAILILALALIIMLVAAFMSITQGKINKANEEYLKWYNSLTPEQQKQEDAKTYASRQIYKVVEFHQWKRISYIDRGFVNQDICYAFTYVDKNGIAKTIEDFRGSIIFSNENKYVINTLTGGQTLYITEQMFKGDR